MFTQHIQQFPIIRWWLGWVFNSLNEGYLLYKIFMSINVLQKCNTFNTFTFVSERHIPMGETKLTQAVSTWPSLTTLGTELLSDIEIILSFPCPVVASLTVLENTATYETDRGIKSKVVEHLLCFVYNWQESLVTVAIWLDSCCRHVATERVAEVFIFRGIGDSLVLLNSVYKSMYLHWRMTSGEECRTGDRLQHVH